MAPHEFAQELHSAAITLENDGDLYKWFTAESIRYQQRQVLWDVLRVLDRPLWDRLSAHNGVFAVEQLRRYLVDVWDVTTDDETPTFNSYREQPTLEFWDEEVKEPPRYKPKAKTDERAKAAAACQALHDQLTNPDLRGLMKAQQETLDRLAKETADSNALYDRLTNDLNSLTQKETTMSKIIDIKTKTFVNGNDVATLTNAQVFDLIAEQEAAIKKLEGIEAKPKLLVKEIEERKAGIAALVAHLDAKAE